MPQSYPLRPARFEPNRENNGPKQLEIQQESKHAILYAESKVSSLDLTAFELLANQNSAQLSDPQGDFPNPMEIFGFFWCFSSWMTWMTHLSPQKSIGRRSTEELQSLRKELQSPLQEARRNKFLRCFRKKPPGRSVEQNDL